MPAYRRGIFLINGRFQIRFAIYVCTGLFALSFIYPVIIYNLFGYFLNYLRVDPSGPAFPVIEKTRMEILWFLIFFQAIVMALAFLISIFISHRIAGPLYKLGRFFQQAKTGNLTEELAFRKKDHFPELADQYNDMVRGLRGIMEKKAEAISASIEHLERAKNQEGSEMKSNLDAAIAALRASQE
ncbi:MAG: hypothetical protein A2428_00890 [Bdellovibrionales bacterium RIFOXYC1_FULL_54_43]|nr:MAG: hypothetical protein A2428_00890 [Bdellovibrionales bacterium RIFOXYC1_FULL_54_43]OFZ82842.1 MAG: hypothetical protein A2603_11615 [Bdellovibrionales bacterium RIFOXYD1_FULL_55_31]